ncbi:dirigent protein 23-like [Cryptomeria japonica]|uniref:dirigent protein 23-like n=1 Tax=Cryptomeria japonica TaxID=3369 RepID=UPI0027DAADFF|nr:dirigent protein 23-like [Cryptomeria japonica]
MEVHPHSGVFAVVLTIIIFASQPTETAAKLKVGKEKVSNLHFYFHDTVSGQNVTAVEVAQAPSNYTSSTFFGTLIVIDDLLTEGPEPTSKLLGRAQGLYAMTSQEDVQLLMAVTFVFQSGEFNGSTVAVVGHNAVFNDVREMPIVGGSGKFRLPRGYALAHTYSFDLQARNAIVHYNVTVLHYQY